MKPKRRIKRMLVKFISLVNEGANESVIIWKSKSDPSKDEIELNQIVDLAKVATEQRMVYGLVYRPEKMDTHGDIASAEVIKQASDDFMRMKNTDQIDMQHDRIAGNGFVAETWIVKSGDPMFPDDEGAWAVGIKVTDDKAWEMVKSGAIKGLSLNALGLVEELSKETVMKTEEIVKGVVAGLKGLFPEKKDDPKVNFDDLTKALESVKTEEEAKEALAALGKFNKDAVAKATEILKEYLPAPKKDDDPNKDDPTELVKAITGAVSDGIKEITGSVKDIGDRLTKLEKTSVGRQSGMDDGAGGDDDKEYKGVDWVGQGS